MALDRTVDLDTILMEDVAADSHPTLIDHRFSFPPAIEAAIAQYADSLERLLGAGNTSDDTYTRGFVAGLRAAAKVAANVAGT
jgi:hypothetical protein